MTRFEQDEIHDQRIYIKEEIPRCIVLRPVAFLLHCVFTYLTIVI